MTKFYLMMIIPNPWLDLDAEPSSSGGDMETCAQAEVSEVANTEPSRVHLAEVACSPSEAISEPESFDCIAEIFAGHAKSHAYRFARKPANKARVTPSREFIPDEEALFEQIEENPMFLQEPLRRAG